LALGFRAGASPVRGRWRRGRGASASLCPRFWPQTSEGIRPAARDPRRGGCRLPARTAVEVVEGYPARQGLRRLAEQFGRSAAENQEARAAGDDPRAPAAWGRCQGAAEPRRAPPGPRRGSSASMGSASLARSRLDSRSKKRDAGSVAPGDWRARVVLPTWRAPSKATTGCSDSKRRTQVTWCGRSIIGHQTTRIRLYAPLKICRLPTNFQPWDLPPRRSSWPTRSA